MHKDKIIILPTGSIASRLPAYRTGIVDRVAEDNAARRARGTLPKLLAKMIGGIGTMNSLTWLGVAIAGTQAVIAVTLLWLTCKHRSTQIRIQRALKVHEWGNECIGVLAEAEQLCLLAPSDVGDRSYAEQKNDLLIRLSALIDRGRMFFRNKEPGAHGQDKPPAFRGFRPAILDPLVAAHMAIGVLDDSVSAPDPGRNSRLWDWRRDFVSLLQEEIHQNWLKEATKYSENNGGGAGLSIGPESVAPGVYR